MLDCIMFFEPVELARFKASRLNSGLYRLDRFFFVIGHLPAHYRAYFKVSTKPGQDLLAALRYRIRRVAAIGGKADVKNSGNTGF